jgi:hypothetical protein
MAAEGSEWARWDLHVHSPLSIVQSYGKGGGDPWERFIADLESLPAEFKVIGINDYLFLDGYRRLVEYKESGRLQNIELVLPVMEFRLNHFGGTDSDLSRLNLHVIFSDALGPDLIQQQFVNGLKCDLTLLPDGVNKADWASLLTRDSLEALGAAFKETLSDELRKQADSDLQEGFNNYNVSFECVVELLESNPLFKNKYFLAVGKAEWADIKWNKQSAAFKKTAESTGGRTGPVTIRAPRSRERRHGRDPHARAEAAGVSTSGAWLAARGHRPGDRLHRADGRAHGPRRPLHDRCPGRVGTPGGLSGHR